MRGILEDSLDALQGIPDGILRGIEQVCKVYRGLMKGILKGILLSILLGIQWGII